MLPLRLAMIGPLPPPNTGTTILFEQLCGDLSRHDGVKLDIVGTLGVRGAGPLAFWRFARLAAAIGRAIWSSDVVALHVNTSGLHIIGPLVLVLAKILGKPLVLRKFGGTGFEHFGWAQSRIDWAVVRRASLYLAETKSLVGEAQAAGIPHVRWYANSRPMAPQPEDSLYSPGPMRKFIYLGQVRATKGIPELIEAASSLGAEASVDIYGPIHADVSEAQLHEAPNICYCGLLTRDHIVETLVKYDALVLPSYYHGEGYPGVVLEAFGAGIPIICTRWRALPELVDETCGLLVEPRNAGELLHAMKRLLDDAPLRERLREGSRQKREAYCSVRWARAFEEMCRELVTSDSGKATAV